MWAGSVARLSDMVLLVSMDLALAFCSELYSCMKNMSPLLSTSRLILFMIYNTVGGSGSLYFFDEEESELWAHSTLVDGSNTLETVGVNFTLLVLLVLSAVLDIGSERLESTVRSRDTFGIRCCITYGSSISHI